jgi:hypothetical protein
MKKTALILAGLVVAIFASEAHVANDCKGGKLADLKPTDIQNIDIVKNKDGRLAVDVVGFCEDGEYVVDSIFLGIKGGITNLYVMEFFPFLKTPAPPLLKEIVDRNFNGYDRINADPNNTCEKPGDFTRSVSTGHGLLGAKDELPPLALKFCGHRTEIRWDNK